jgi:hypothetical protein
LVAVAIAGLLGLSARAVAVSGYELVTVKGTILVQTNDTLSKNSVEKFKITNKEILKLIAAEYVTNFPSGFPAGAQLAVDYFFDGEFYVLDKNGTVLLANAGASQGGDSYDLYLYYDNYVYTGSDTASKTTYNYTTIGEFYYQDASGINNFDVYGLTTVKETYKTSSGSESFKMTGLAGDGFIDGNNAVVSGTVKGSGKNIAD